VRRLTERQQAIVFGVALTISLAGLYGMIQAIQPPPVTSKGVLRASLVVEGDGWTMGYLDVETRNNTAFGILLEAGDRKGFSVEWVDFAIPPGAFVTAINGTVNGQGGKWWQYWVNDVYGDVASNRKELFDGDLVQWRFVVSLEGSA